MKTLVIVNPAARQGKSGARWGQVEARLKEHGITHDVQSTTAPGHGKALAAAAMNEGYQRLVAVGGDGTINEVLNGMLRDAALVRPDVVLAPIPAGTGLDGNSIRIHSALATSIGAAALISYKTSTSRFIKKLGAELSYYIVALQVTLSYRPTVLQVRIDDGETTERIIHSALVCNMRYVGGGMDMAPMAKPDDGIGDLIEFGDFKRLDLLLKPKSWLFEGKHIADPAISVFQGVKFHFAGNDDILVDSDGETVGRLPVTIETIKHAFRINI